MKVLRRNFLRLTAGAAALPALSRIAQAQTYPTRPVHLISGFAAGGIVDILARLIGQRLSDRLGQPFVVDDRPGAASNVAAELVAKATPDGYTLLLESSANAWNTALYNNLKFDFLTDITPVASIGSGCGVMEVTPSFPAKTVAEFIAYAKANPGTIYVAAAGPGSGPHLYSELFKKMAGVDLVTVHYRGSGPALPDVISGRVPVMFDLATSSIGYIRAGKLRPLGVTTAERCDVLPNVPPIGDFVPGYEAKGWEGIGAPKGTPTDIIAILNKEVNAALAYSTFKARLADLGVTPIIRSPAEFGNFIAQYTEKWTKVIRAANIKAE